MDFAPAQRHGGHVDERTDQVGFLLTRVAGILEDASALAARAQTARDGGRIAELQRAITDAQVLPAAAAVSIAGQLPQPSFT